MLTSSSSGGRAIGLSSGLAAELGGTLYARFIQFIRPPAREDEMNEKTGW